MMLTKELVQQDIANLEANLKNVEASMNKIIGALTFAKDLVAFMDREEEAPKVNTDISEENAAIQAREEEAMSLQALADSIDGPAALADEPQPLYDYPDEHQEAEEESLDADREH